ncbi:MAG: RNA methyltransferase [Pseudomonadota bacterium]|nr:RNA methyltransferase [Pseudomonadota bacterium]
MINQPDRVRVVLVSTSHPGNIGAVARAMKVMGFTNLHLVRPKKFPSEEAIALASGANDILEDARRHDNLAEALEGTSLAYATTARSRHMSLPVCSPRAAALELGQIDDDIALVFGQENSGLTNDQLNLCHRIITIPSNSNFSSLNLAQAVQICLYELRTLVLIEGEKNHPTPKGDRLAYTDEIQNLAVHLIRVMQLVDYHSSSRPRRLQQRIHRLLGRAGLLRSEIQILRGFLSSVEKRLHTPD